MHANWRAVVLLTLAAGLWSLAGCSGTPTRHSALDERVPGRRPIDFKRIPDAVPKPEPPSRYGNPPTYTALGKRYWVLPSNRGYVERGVASWYGPRFHGKPTSTRETYDMFQMTAAHKTLPLPTYARVTNLRNGRSIVVRINDRGPFIDGRVIDLSYVAAGKLGIIADGTAPVELRTIDSGFSTPPPLIARAAPRTADLPGAAAVRTPAVPASIPARRIYLQVGSYDDLRQAQAVSAQLRQRNLPRLIRSDGARHRVQIGPLASTSAALDLGLTLSRQGIVNPRVVVE